MRVCVQNYVICFNCFVVNLLKFSFSAYVSLFVWYLNFLFVILFCNQILLKVWHNMTSSGQVQTLKAASIWLFYLVFLLQNSCKFSLNYSALYFFSIFQPIFFIKIHVHFSLTKFLLIFFNKIPAIFFDKNPSHFLWQNSCPFSSTNFLLNFVWQNFYPFSLTKFLLKFVWKQNVSCFSFF